MSNNSLLTKSYYLFLPFVISLAVMSPATWAVTVEVCPIGCAYDSPVTAVNDETRDDGDIINVHFGTYVINGTLQVDQQLTILGNDSIFDANGIRAINVFFATGNLTINDLTIRNGQPTAGFGGGAVSVWGGATLTVTGGIFENNQAEFGGAIHNDGSTVTLSESVFSGNRATAGEGGAIWTNGGGTTELTKVEVDGNMASVGGGGLAIGGDGSHLEIIASTISGNAELLPIQTASNPVVSGTSEYCGTVAHGQFFVADALALSAFEFEIRLNGPVGDPDVIPISLSIPGQVRSGGIFGPVIATAQAVAPGGVWLGGSTQTLTFKLDKVLALNPGGTYVIEMFPDTDYFTMLVSADDFGGGDRYCGGLITEGSDWAFRTFGGTPGDNAGIYAQANSTVRLDTSTVSGNLGDGIVVEDSTLESIFSTIAWNYGNGFTSIGTLAGGTFSSTLFSGNGGNDCDSSNFTSLGYNLVEEDTGCSITPAIGDQIGDSANPINAVLAPLSNNGGFTSTHAFGPDTPAVDGAGTGCSGNLDQRGVARPKGLACDIGAFESVPALQSAIDNTPPGNILIVPPGTYQELIIIGDDKGLRAEFPGTVEITARGISIPGSVITATGNFSLEGIRVTDGISPDNGGGINASIAGTNITLDNVVFENNNAASGGGAIYLQNGTLDGTNVMFDDNSAIDGGAIHNEGSIVTISESVFSRNSASDGQGSAILTDSGGSTTLTKTTVDNNSSPSGGGVLAVVDPGSVLNVFASTVSNNNSGSEGQVIGIHVSDGAKAWLDTSTVSGHEFGWGIVVEPGEVVDPPSFMKATFSTIAENQDGFYAVTGSIVEFESSIIAGSDFNDCNGNGSITSHGYNLLGREDNCVFTPSIGDLIGTTEEAVNPLLGPLQDNGGLTLTHSIEPNSPAVNAGGSACIEDLDQRGVGRPIGSACDIGAYEADAVPLQLGPVVLSVTSLGQHQLSVNSYPGVIDVPIIEIPIEKLTGDTFSAPESAPLGSFPLGSFPIGSFDLRNAPMGSFPLGSFPIGSFPLGSFPLGSFPLGSFPLSSIPLQSAGGWTEILNTTPELADLAGAPLQTVTLEQLLRVSPLPDAVASIALRDLSIQGSPLASLSLPGLSLGNTTVEKIDEWAQNADPGADTVCATLLAEGPLLTGCTDEDTLLGLEMEGAPISALSLASLPLGSFQVGSLPIGSFPLGSFPIGSFPLGSFPLGSFPLGSFPLGSFPIGSFPLGSFPLGLFPLGSFNLLAAPLGSFPLGSFPIGSFPLGSFSIDGKSFCEFYDEQALASGDSTCAGLGITNPDTDNLADLVGALRIENPAVNIGSTPLGSFPLGSFPIGSFPIGSFDLATLSTPPISELTLAVIDGCTVIENNSSDTCTSRGLTNSSTLAEAAIAYGGSLEASPLGSFPIGSFDVAGLPMGSFPLGSFDVNGAPLGSFPLGSFDLITSPLGSFPIGSFSDGSCAECLTLADAARAGVIDGDATLADLKTAEPTKFAALTLGDVLDAMTLSTLYCPPDPDPNSGPEVDCAETLGEIEDTGNLTLGQLLIAMMLKTDFPWETISLEQLDAQEFSADHFVTYTVDILLTGTESEPVSIAVTLDDSFMYVEGSASLIVETPLAINPSVQISDPTIVNNRGTTQTLSFNLILGGFSSNTISFEAVPALALGDYPATATVQLGTVAPVVADNTNSGMTVVPHWFTDVPYPDDAPTSPVDVLLLGFIDTPDDIDYFKVAPPAAGDRVAVFMANPASDNDLVMYEPLSTVEAKGQTAAASALDSVPFEDDGVDYAGNLTEEPNALEDVNLRSAPLASISTNRDDADEAVSAIAGNTEPFTIQVSGYNGATSDDPYTLRVKVTPEVPSPSCTGRSWPGTEIASIAPAGRWRAGTNAVFLVNGSRLASSDPGGSTAADAALAAINDLISAPGITNGVVVDVSSIGGVSYAAWDANPCDADAANDIVNAITSYLEAQRTISPNLAYVTIVGSDEVIPFARKPDETSIANESTFAGEFSDNAMYGALVTRHFLSDDTYGDIDPIAWLDRYLNVPELGVGRLVESAADIQTAAENYITFAGILDPGTALSAGYDFIADASQDIDDTFKAYGPVLGFSIEQSLIDQPGVDPSSAWTGDNFLLATGLNNPNPVDLVSFNMHFDFDEALPSSGDAEGNYKDNLLTTADLGVSDLDGGIWFTVGCHSGTNVPDVSVVGNAPSEDWAQSFSRLGALYLAQNAYGLGDTEAIALTERLMANFARNLNGTMSIGQAHAFAKQQYFADLGLYGEYDFKALQAATLFGLPMYQYGIGPTVTDPLPPVLPVTTDPISGLASASWLLSSTGIAATATAKGDLFSVDGEVQFVHYRPLQPIVRRDVTSINGEIASGAFLTSLVTEDTSVDDIAFARPVIALGKIEPEVETADMVFPTAFTNIASYMAPSASGGPFAPRQQLNVIVGQYTSPADGSNAGTERLFRSFESQVFYRPSPTSLLTTVAEDFIRPEFDNVQASVVGSGSSRQAAFSVKVTDKMSPDVDGEVLRVAILYLKEVNSVEGTWALADLRRGAGGNTWTGGGPVDVSGLSGDEVDYMVQAVDANGNVANSTFKGLFYVADELETAPAPHPPNEPGPIGIILYVDGDEVVDPSHWITSEPVQVEVTNQVPGTSYVYSVDSAPFVPLTPAGFQVTGNGVHIVTVQESDGSNPVTFAVLIDTALLKIEGPTHPIPLGDPVTISVIKTGLNERAKMVTIDWGDDDGISTSESNTVTQSGDSFTADYTYAAPGVYPITVKIEYDNGYIQTGVFEFAVIYDPSGGFVTGGGWIDSPVGAYTSDPALTGKAHFGFVSKYKKGQSVPDGSTNFRFAAGDLEFDATVYEWMIITKERARYKGEGTVNDGAELYKFMVTALDADVSSPGITEDAFRIKIWLEDDGGIETVLYDNGLGADSAEDDDGTTALGGGSITVHAVKKK